MAKQKKKGKKLNIDFGGTDKEIRKRSKRVPEGDYLAKITKGEVKKNKAGDGRHIVFTVQLIEDARGNKKYGGIPFWYRCSLKPDALFNLRNVIFAASDGKKNVAGKAVSFDPTSLTGKRIGVTVEDGEYEKKIRSEVVDVMPPSMLVEDEEESDEAEDEDEEEEEDEDEDEEEEDDDDEEEEEDEDELEDVDDDDL